jgi:hypothetical protein
MFGQHTCKKAFTLGGYKFSDIHMFQVQRDDVYASVQPPMSSLISRRN